MLAKLSEELWPHLMESLRNLLCLRPGDIVIMDNIGSHKAEAI